MYPPRFFGPVAYCFVPKSLRNTQQNGVVWWSLLHINLASADELSFANQESEVLLCSHLGTEHFPFSVSWWLHRAVRPASWQFCFGVVKW